jgi:hypothetical protein
VSTGPRTLACIDCGTTWEWRPKGRTSLDVRCPGCALLAARRAEIQQHLEQLVTSDDGHRVAAVALAAAHRASAGTSGTTGRASLANAFHRLARSGSISEAALQARIVEVAAAAVLWAAEIAEALDG